MRFLFADHTLDSDRRELRRGADAVAVEPQVFDLLIYLVQNRDRVVSKDDLIASIWGGRIVSESTLTSRINAARRAVGDSGEDQKLIRTIARKGIRFVGAVRAQSNDGEPAQAGGPPPTKLRAHTSGVAPARPARHRRAPFHRHERRSGAGIFLRWHQRGHHHRAVEAALVLRNRAQLVVHLQGQGRRQFVVSAEKNNSA